MVCCLRLPYVCFANRQKRKIFKQSLNINCHVAASGNEFRKTATEEIMKAGRWQLIFFNAPAICLLRKQAEAQNIQAKLEY